MPAESRAIDGGTSASGDNGGAASELSNSAALVTSLTASRLLPVFRMLLSSACTTYSLPILTIE